MHRLTGSLVVLHTGCGAPSSPPVDEAVETDTAPAAPSETAAPTLPNTPPRAFAGRDLDCVAIPGTLTLDGSRSTDLDGDMLSWAWELESAPEGATPTFVGPKDGPTAQVSLPAGDPGDTVFRLTVNDGQAEDVDRITLRTFDPSTNAAPVADAGEQLRVYVADFVQLDGTASSDPEGDPLTWAWTIVSRPPGSTTTLDAPDTPNPSFLVDALGLYTLQLVVSDCESSSTPDLIVIQAGTR